MIAPFQTVRSNSSKPFSVRFRATLFAFTAAVTTATAITFVPVANGGTQVEPTELQIADKLVPGRPLECTVSVSEGTGPVAIYSEPAGAVSYQGTISSPTATVSATTSPDVDTDSVTIYVTTGGTQVIGTEVAVEVAADAEVSDADTAAY